MAYLLLDLIEREQVAGLVVVIESPCGLVELAGAYSPKNIESLVERAIPCLQHAMDVNPEGRLH